MNAEKIRFEKGSPSANFSLLYPPDASPDQQNLFLELSPAVAHDLGIDDIVAAFTSDREHQNEIRKLFSRLPRDPATISYRQDTLADLLTNPELVEKIASFLPVIDSLCKYSYRSAQEMRSLYEVIWRMGELQNIIDCFEGLHKIFGVVGEKISSQGLRMLREEVHEAQKEESYQNLIRELPLLLAQVRACASVTIGVNLDASLRPIQATLLSVNDRPFTDQTLLNKLFGIKKDREGIGPLHSVPQRAVEGPYAFPVNSDLGWAVEPMMIPLFADLAKVLEKAAQPIAEQLSQYADIRGRLLISLRQALIFYLGAVHFIQHFQELGLPMCRPRIVPSAERLCEISDSYNVHLALKYRETDSAVVPPVMTNDIIVGPDRQILILTGPNQGGKTTYTQGAGIVHVLAQVGCYVPGRKASISPLDQLFTHFPLEEKPDSDTGRFGEEAVRLRKIFEQLTRHSLVLLNESLSSTSFSESLYLAQDIVRILRQVGVRAIYSTHLHELAGRVDELNKSVPGDSTIVSVVSSPMDTGLQGSEVIHTYKVEIRPPLGQSYAREIAARYGISYQQLEKFLSERGVL